jgi:hypothetical protein
MPTKRKDSTNTRAGPLIFIDLPPTNVRPQMRQDRSARLDAVKESSYAGGTACATTTSPALSEMGRAVPPASPAYGRLFHSFLRRRRDARCSTSLRAASVGGCEKLPANGQGANSSIPYQGCLGEVCSSLPVLSRLPRERFIDCRRTDAVFRNLISRLQRRRTSQPAGALTCARARR